MTIRLPMLSVTDRTRLKELVLQRSQVLPTGRMWFCLGRKIVAQGNLIDAPKVAYMGRLSIDTLVVSSADYEAVREWIG